MGLPTRHFASTGWELSYDDLDTFSAAIAGTDAGSGPSRPAIMGVV
jgi:hypothetical protein